ncbi:hypothetical protein CISIN_1g035143mg [Citrus sinensis]|uniref:Uncharacterized protein n=1 Tax=Citrus sinensis TaxID=2711 RepID=A0A067GV47_CITSI|nr:hypothetical protein CISIN_1g035143mg [Citrus sinensis]
MKLLNMNKHHTQTHNIYTFSFNKVKMLLIKNMSSLEKNCQLFLFGSFSYVRTKSAFLFSYMRSFLVRTPLLC